MRSVGGDWRGVGRWQKAAEFAVDRYDFRSRGRAECSSPVPSALGRPGVEASITHADADSSGHGESRLGSGWRSCWLSRSLMPQFVWLHLPAQSEAEFDDSYSCRKTPVSAS